MTAIQRLQLCDNVLILLKEVPVHGARIMLIVVDFIVSVLVARLRAIGARRRVTLEERIFLYVTKLSELIHMKRYCCFLTYALISAIYGCHARRFQLLLPASFSSTAHLIHVIGAFLGLSVDLVRAELALLVSAASCSAVTHVSYFLVLF